MWLAKHSKCRSVEGWLRSKSLFTLIGRILALPNSTEAWHLVLYPGQGTIAQGTGWFPPLSAVLFFSGIWKNAWDSRKSLRLDLSSDRHHCLSFPPRNDAFWREFYIWSVEALYNPWKQQKAGSEMSKKSKTQQNAGHWDLLWIPHQHGLEPSEINRDLQSLTQGYQSRAVSLGRGRLSWNSSRKTNEYPEIFQVKGMILHEQQIPIQRVGSAPLRWVSIRSAVVGLPENRSPEPYL